MFRKHAKEKKSMDRRFIHTILVIAAISGAVLFFFRTQDQAFYALPPPRSELLAEKEALYSEALHRVELYERLITQDHLLDGMVINRDSEFEPEDICDSLLFSSLRYAALRRLNLDAGPAWTGITNSKSNRMWLRHPRCVKPLSRDMLMGLFTALHYQPPGSKLIVEELLSVLGKRRGYFSDGPFYVSYLSPGIAGLARYLAEEHGIPFARWPWVVKQSFSSIEYDTIFLQKGFESHLAALGLWLELDFSEGARPYNPRSILGEVERRMTNENNPNQIGGERGRREWITEKMIALDPKNLFFRYLYLKVHGQFDELQRLALLDELLRMPGFPADRLPNVCDRAADYMWQRYSSEYPPRETLDCRRQFAGVDFLWMVSLLVQK
jgi:hypothetical protein